MIGPFHLLIYTDVTKALDDFYNIYTPSLINMYHIHSETIPSIRRGFHLKLSITSKLKSITAKSG